MDLGTDLQWTVPERELGGKLETAGQAPGPGQPDRGATRMATEDGLGCLSAGAVIGLEAATRRKEDDSPLRDRPSRG